MAKCEISTGRKTLAVGKSGGEETPSSLLFDHKSSSAVSHFINIEPCQVFKFSTFGLPDGVTLTLHRVYLAGGVMPQGTGCICEPDPAKGVQPMATEVFKINCKPVVIDNCNGALFLSVPGTYVLELNDESKLGNFIAMAEEVECCCVPNGLLIGNVGINDTYVGTK